MSPNHFVTTWLEDHDGPPGQALVVACGLGDDAEALAGAGWKVTAFDIAPSAIRWCRERFPDSEVDYQVADLFALPVQWAAGFDLVVEVLTVQSLPPALQGQAMRAIATQVAPGGRVLVYTVGRRTPEQGDGPPWPLARSDLDEFTATGLTETSFVSRPSPWDGFDVFDVEYTRPRE